MLKRIIEYQNGTLSIKFRGSLKKEDTSFIYHYVYTIIKKYGIKDIVLDLNDLVAIDKPGINALKFLNKIVKEKRGILKICHINTRVINIFLNNSSFKECMYR